MSIRANESNNLAVRYPQIALQWDYEKNDSLKPENVMPKSHIKYWWRCDKGHVWDDSPSNRTRRSSGCPYCGGYRVSDEYNLAVKYPNIAKQWNYEKNGDVKPSDILPHSNIKFWWECDKGHTWDESPADRIHNNSGCPFCSNHRVCIENCLATKCPDIASQWHPTKNGSVTPYDVMPNTNKRYWWQCEKGHEWCVTPNNRMTTGCPYCSGRKASSDHCVASEYPWMVDEWHPTKNGKFTPYNVTPSSGRKIWFVCPLGHEWMDTVPHRVSDGRGCTICNRGTQTSFPEQAIYFYMEQVFSDAINRYKVEFDGKRFESDIFIPSIKLCIEYDGYVHMEQVEHDIVKARFLLDNSMKVIRVREHDIPRLVCENVYVIHRCDDSFDDLKTCIVSIFDYIRHEFNVPIDCDVDLKRDCCKIYAERYTRQVKDSFGEKNPDLLLDWNYERNFTLNPLSLKPFSGAKVWWKCRTCGNEWSARIRDRTRGTGCPKCRRLNV